jgi:hypothetical protein
MPANARNSVLLPDPDGPVMSTELRGASVIWGDQRAPVRQRDAEAFDCKVRLRDVRDLNAGSILRGEAGTLGVIVKARETINGCSPFGNFDVSTDKPREGILHLPKCRSGLHQAAKLDGPREIVRRGDHERENNRRLAVAGLEPGEPFLALHDRPPVTHDVTEARSQMAHFIGFPAVQGDAFGMLAHAHERKTEIGLVFLLMKIESDQGPADDVGEPGAHQCIGEREPHHISGNA